MCCGALTRARTLLYVAYFLLALDALLYVGFVAGGVYVERRCPTELESHSLMAYSHFFGTMAIAATIADWWSKMEEGEEGQHKLPTTLPLYWAVGVLVALATDTFQFLAQLHNPEPSTECSFRMMHKVLEGYGVCVDSLSLLWFMCVTVALWRQLRKQSRARREALNPTPVPMTTIIKM